MVNYWSAAVLGAICLMTPGCGGVRPDTSPVAPADSSVANTLDQRSRVTLFSRSAVPETCKGQGGKEWNPSKISHPICLIVSPTGNDPLALLDENARVKGKFVSCGLGAESAGNQVAVGALGLVAINWAISAFVSLVVDSADKELQDYISGFTSQHAITSKGVDFYAAFPKDFQTSDKFTICVRYTRFMKSKAAGEQDVESPHVAVDFIGSITHDPADPNYLMLRPVRLYYENMSRFTARRTQTVNDAPDKAIYRISAALSIRTASAGMHGIDVDSAQVAAANFGTASVTSAEVSKPDSAYYHLFDKGNKSDGIPETRIPLPAWNLRAIGRGPESTAADVSVAITEAGSPDEVLSAFAKWLHKQKDSVNKDLTGLAQKSVCNTLDPTGKSCK
jgi:hypothetical protein